MIIQSKHKGKDVYSVKRLFSKEDMLTFVADGGLIRYKRTENELERARKEFKVDIRVSTFLSLFVIFAFLSMFIINFSSMQVIGYAQIIKGLILFIVPCITSVLALMKYTEYKEQLVKKYFLDLEKLKEKHAVARKFSYEEIVAYCSISKKINGIKGDLTFYSVSNCMLAEEHRGRSVLAVLNKETTKWSILEYHLDGTHLDMYNFYDITEESQMVFEWLNN